MQEYHKFGASLARIENPALLVKLPCSRNDKINRDWILKKNKQFAT